MELQQTPSFTGVLNLWQEKFDSESLKMEELAATRVLKIEKLLDETDLPYPLFLIKSRGLSLLSGQKAVVYWVIKWG